MKKKALFSIVAIALFTVAIAFNSQKNETEDLTVKNQEALAGFTWHEGLGMYIGDGCSGPACCVMPDNSEEGWSLYHQEAF
jgi:hypothetical protein